MADLYPMLIAPRYDERIWGGHNLIWPGLTLVVLVALFGAYALVDGLMALVATVRAGGTVKVMGFLLGLLSACVSGDRRLQTRARGSRRADAPSSAHSRNIWRMDSRAANDGTDPGARAATVGTKAPSARRGETVPKVV